MNSDMSFTSGDVTKVDFINSRIVSVPDGRTFVIGGAQDFFGTWASGRVFELKDGEFREKASL